MKASLVAVLDDGRIAEMGEPIALLGDPSSRFASLARAQLIPEVSATSVAELRVERGLGDDGDTHRSRTEQIQPRWWHRV
jgi:hypothetical protein